MLPVLDGVDADARARAADAYPARLARTVEETCVTLARAGRLRDGIPAPLLSLPPSFAALLGAVETALHASRARPILAHYLDAMPRLRVEQLVARDAHLGLLDETLDPARTPRLVAGLATLAAVARDAGVDPGPAADPSLPSVASRYARAFWGGFMPLLYGFPSDLAALAVERAGGPAEPVVERRLSAPLVHEAAHGARERCPLFPPYLDECIAAWLGVAAVPQFLFPDEGADDGVFASARFAQVGQALARVVGPRRLARAHFAAMQWSDWEDALGPSLARSLAGAGWREIVTLGEPHFLSSNLSPQPWIKRFFLGGADPTGVRWRDIPVPPEDEALDRALLVDGLRAMCVDNRREGTRYRVRRRVPASIRIDLDECTLTSPPGDGGLDPRPLEYLFPPSLAARLRRRGPTVYEVRLEHPDGIEALAATLHAG